MTRQLRNLLDSFNSIPIEKRFENLEFRSISVDSRTVQKGDIFVALKGPNSDGADFIEDVLEKGVEVIVVEHNKSLPSSDKNVCIIQVPSTKEFLHQVLKQLYGKQSQSVKTIGITGTNGKTTTTYLIESILAVAYKKCGIVGTINHRIGLKVFPSHNTTPGLIDNYQFLSQIYDEQGEYCIMEVSSHALDQGRVDTLDFAVAIFTNLTGDHLDYHRTMDNYFLAKSKLFTNLSKQAYAIINNDDVYASRLMEMTQATILPYGLKEKVAVTASDLAMNLRGSTMIVHTPQGNFSLKTKLIGQHNVYNILAATAACVTQGISLEKIKDGIENMECVPGRLEQVDCGQDFAIFVDYAHTHDALHNVLTAIRQVHPKKIILVFGCGGNRDKTKRPKMGEVACRLADFSILTNDNPRGEEPEDIVKEVLGGFTNTNYEVILDREQAIQKALQLARPGDVVLIAGKGHEDYQIFKDKTIHFDDCEVARKYLTC